MKCDLLETTQIKMKQPSAFFGQMWREAVPLGNGLTGALVYGGVATEHILLNRYDLWHMEKRSVLPRVSDVFCEMRKRMDEGDYSNAQNMLCDALRKEGYDPEPGVPLPLGMLKIEISQDGVFKKYDRCLYPDKGECEITYQEKGKQVHRRCFISRYDDIFVYKAQAEVDKEFKISLGLHDDGTINTERKIKELGENYRILCRDEFIFLIAKNKDKFYGAAVKAVGSGNEDGVLSVRGKETTVLVKCFSNCDILSEEIMMTAINKYENSYDSLLERHLPMHKALYSSVELSLSEDMNVTNEALLDEAYQEEVSAALMERLWKFGRYLFISGTCEDGLPFPLYGLWHGEYAAPWAQHVANENVQIIYWHLLTGNLSGLMKPLIKYYCSHLEEYREAADRLFGCRGIFLSVYSTPVNSKPAPVVPVIMHYIGVAGWLSQHFYDYYRMTNDKVLLEEYILPFMKEAALFYEDYACYDKHGKLELYPSVSPENSPRNFMDNPEAERMSHSMPVTRNATMDIGILKGLLQNLVLLSEEVNIDPEDIARWQGMLDKLPAYEVNEEGAVREWQHPEFEDNYFHRHLSHIYPFFPGDEVTKEDVLYPAFEKAVELRVLQGQSGWSLAHMAGIYAAMGKGEEAAECIDNLCKGCVQNNLMTMHNDYRSMGVSLELGQFAPIQLDANMGIVNAVQMMLLQIKNKTIHFLPALPQRLHTGSVKNFAFPGGYVDFAWKQDEFHAVVKAEKDISVIFRLPENGKTYYLHMGGEKCKYEQGKSYDIKQGMVINIYSL